MRHRICSMEYLRSVTQQRCQPCELRGGKGAACRALGVVCDVSPFRLNRADMSRLFCDKPYYGSNFLVGIERFAGYTST